MKRRTASLLASLAILCPFASAITTTHTNAAVISSITNPLIGTWRSTQFGTQVLNARPDGSAELKMRLSTMAAVLYGREVTLDLQWTLDGSTLVQHVTGGAPERSVQKLIKKYGETSSYKVLKLTKSELVLEDAATGKICRWESITETSSAE